MDEYEIEETEKELAELIEDDMRAESIELANLDVD
jgi:hypothetical protein